MQHQTNRNSLFALAVSVFFFWSATSHAAAPVFMPGFPMRAGSVAILMWAPVPGATEYKLFKKVEGGEFQETYRGPMNNFSDPAASPEKTITYKVIAVIGGKEGEPSKEVVLVGIKPLDPPTINGVLSDPGGLRVRWSVVQGAAFYNLYRADSEAGPYNLLASLQDPQYFDREPKAGKTVHYQVTAVDKMNSESPRSKAVAGLIQVASLKEKEYTPTYKEIRLKGEYRGEPNAELSRPVGFGIDKKGELVVVEEFGLQILDKSGNFLRRVYFDEGWSRPYAAMLTRDDVLFVTFNDSNKVRKIDLEGNLLKEFTLQGNPEAEIKTAKAGSLDLDGEGNLWVADFNSSQVITLDPTGKEIGRVGRVRGSKEKIEGAVDITVPGRIRYRSEKDEIWVVDTVNAVIQVFKAKGGEHVGTIGGRKNKDGSDFQGIGGVDFKPNGNVLVMDPMVGIVKEFSPGFEYMYTYVDPVENPRRKLHTNYMNVFYYHPERNTAYISSMMLGTCWEYPLGD